VTDDEHPVGLAEVDERIGGSEVEHAGAGTDRSGLHRVVSGDAAKVPQDEVARHCIVSRHDRVIDRRSNHECACEHVLQSGPVLHRIDADIFGHTAHAGKHRQRSDERSRHRHGVTR
jgi:hypothetical protein